eukprot:CAMPEP_0119356406 /NCGR_PEP_ID=MMETSP1334-20130426/5020_1 /TAXON_ID=127549 /ORGANISM="Calcidiscus leptoporus, Strain RCC1130" /LENGTH=163 /DNA_ID=CAMNT_0007370427 /DNA_START=6 /DNA_END=497 /DNA_ORIENTATION=+
MGFALHSAFFLAGLAFSPAALKKEVVVSGWPALPYPFSTGIIACLGPAGLPAACSLSLAGQQGFDFAASPPALVAGGIANETRQVLLNLAAVAEAASSSLDNMIECTVLLTDIKDFELMNSVYKTFFVGEGKVPPTRIASQVASLAGTAVVEIKCSGWAPHPS